MCWDEAPCQKPRIKPYLGGFEAWQCSSELKPYVGISDTPENAYACWKSMIDAEPERKRKEIVRQEYDEVMRRLGR